MPSHLLSLAMGSKSSGSFRDNLGEEDNFQEKGKAPSDLAKLLCHRVGDSLEWGRDSLLLLLGKMSYDRGWPVCLTGSCFSWPPQVKHLVKMTGKRESQGKFD